MNSSDIGSPSLTERLTLAQLDKLVLEIAQIDREVHGGRWLKRIAAMTPLLSVVIAVAGFLFGIYQFQSQQEELQNRFLEEQQRSAAIEQRQQRLNIQADVRADAQELLRFFSDQKQTVAIAVFRLQNLKINIALGSSLPLAGASPSLFDQAIITTSIVKAVVNDCDLNRPRDAAFVATLLTSWPDYSRYVSDDQVAAGYITEQYARAIEALAVKAPEAMMNVRDNPARNEYFFKGDVIGLSRKDQGHFDDLISGFTAHLKFVRNVAERAEQLQHLGRVMHNEEFMRQLNSGGQLVPLANLRARVSSKSSLPR